MNHPDQDVVLVTIVSFWIARDIDYIEPCIILY
jgi:hypothetical protein